jgi:hypothetical protein
MHEMHVFADAAQLQPGGGGGGCCHVKKVEKKLKKNWKSTAPGIPRRSPIQVLTGLDVA